MIPRRARCVRLCHKIVLFWSFQVHDENAANNPRCIATYAPLQPLDEASVDQQAVEAAHLGPAIAANRRLHELVKELEALSVAEFESARSK